MRQTNRLCVIVCCARSGFRIDERNGESASTRRKVPVDRHTTLTRKRAAASQSHPKSWSDAKNSDWRKNVENRKNGWDDSRSGGRQISSRVAKSRRRRRSRTRAVCRRATAVSRRVTTATRNSHALATSTIIAQTAPDTRHYIISRLQTSPTTTTTTTTGDVAIARRPRWTWRRHTRRSASGASYKRQRDRSPAMRLRNRCVGHVVCTRVATTAQHGTTPVLVVSCWCRPSSLSHSASRSNDSPLHRASLRQLPSEIRDTRQSWTLNSTGPCLTYGTASLSKQFLALRNRVDWWRLVFRAICNVLVCEQCLTQLT